MVANWTDSWGCVFRVGAGDHSDRVGVHHRCSLANKHAPARALSLGQVCTRGWPQCFIFACLTISLQPLWRLLSSPISIDIRFWSKPPVEVDVLQCNAECKQLILSEIRTRDTCASVQSPVDSSATASDSLLQVSTTAALYIAQGHASRARIDERL